MTDVENDHPSVQTLKNFVAGLLNQSQLDTIEQHLVDCEPCCQRLTSFTDTDPVAERIRQLADVPGTESPSHVVRLSSLKNLLGSSVMKPDVAADVLSIRQLGDYQILREIGRGGMGIVFEARQISLGRRVAVKVLLHGSLADDKQKQRFLREAEAVACLHHTNIVPVFGVGEDHGLPYFVMQLIDGIPLTAAANFSTSAGNRATAFQRIARLGAQAADALDYAHRQGILHRDIKPGNLLLDDTDTIWLTDFGLAKADDGRGLTETGDVMGTLRYIAPEALNGVSDARTDVYALGLTLFELLAGRPAFDTEKRSSFIDDIANASIPRLDAHCPDIPRDLETIVYKAIDGSPESRYQTAGLFAADLRRYLNDEPIQARRISSWELLRRWINRNRGLAASLSTIVLLLVTGFITALIVAVDFREKERIQHGLAASNSQLAEEKSNLAAEKTAEADRANQNEREAVTARRLAEDNARNTQRALYFARMLLAGRSAESPTGIQHVIDTTSRWHPDVAGHDWRGWEWYYLVSHCHRAELKINVPMSAVYWAAWSPDDQSIAMAGDRRVIRIFDATTGEDTRRLSGHKTGIRCVQWSPQGDRLASNGGSELIVWNAATGKILQRISNHSGTVNRIAWSPDGSLLASGAESEIRIWNAADGALLRVITAAGGPVKSVAWHPSGNSIAGPYRGTDIGIWKIDDGELQTTLSGHTRRVLAVQWDSGGNRLASSGKDATVRIWDIVEQKELRSWTLPQAARTVAWNPDEKSLVVSGDDCAARILKRNRSGTILPILGHTIRVTSASFNADGDRLVTASTDSSVRIWKTSGSSQYTLIDGHKGEIEAVAWSPDGSRLATAAADQTVAISNPDTGALLRRLRGQKGHLSCVQWSPDGSRIASGAWNGSVVIWNAESGTLQHTLQRDEKPVESVCWNADGSRLFSGHSNGTIAVWDAESGKALTPLIGHANVALGLAISHDGGRLASCSADNTLRIWSLSSGECLTAAKLSPQRLNQVAWNPADTLLAIVGADGYMRVFDVASETERYRTRSDNGFSYFVSWSPDERRIATAGADRSVKLWDAETGEATFSLGEMQRAIRGVEFSPDGTRIAAASRDSTVRVWDARQAYGIKAAAPTTAPP